MFRSWDPFTFVFIIEHSKKLLFILTHVSIFPILKMKIEESFKYLLIDIKITIMNLLDEW